MQNLRITPKRKFVDSYATGDHQGYNVFEIRRDYTKEELSKINYSNEVIKSGVVLETFSSEENAEIFLNALKSKTISKRDLVIKQIELQHRIQTLANVNIIECNNCSAIIMHDRGYEDGKCFNCNSDINFHECTDYWYEGAQNSSEFK